MAEMHKRSEPEQRMSPRAMYGRDIACTGNDNVPIQKHATTEEIVVDLSDLDSLESGRDVRARILAARAQANEIYKQEMSSGGLCVDPEGHVMVTPLCQRLPKVVIVR